MTDPMENFRRYVDDSVNLLALDLAALLNRAHALGVAICPDVDDLEGISYSINWAFKTLRYLDVEWDNDSERWAVIGGTVEGIPQTRPVVDDD